ncbi:hypothetical protein [Glycomyces buryatensis]|uniref:Uncharacterized protein n=1 Tax=Glycomyces buryatensis TaxID=2570927 RepID=A0A4V4HRX8_9ACTN|nr:hypothetical protein [Glycomyces buryatensis]THV39636.1 hypothetical protein FAB82_17350 [Glycomyces buryatensis]
MEHPHWHYVSMDLDPIALTITPVFSPPLTDRVIAHLETQRLLDAAAVFKPEIAEAAKLWRCGADDDFVQAGGRLTWAIFECEGASCEAGRQAYLDDWAANIEAATGVALRVPRVETDA